MTPALKRSLRFLVAAAGLIALIALVMTLFFPGPENLRAIGISAALALAVQLASFAILYAMRGQGVMIGWGLGSLLRFTALVTYGFLATGTLGLPLGAALLSLAAFLFATSILEPVMLER